MIFQINPGAHTRVRTRVHTLHLIPAAGRSRVRVRVARESRPISIQWKDGVKIHSDSPAEKWRMYSGGTM